MTHNSTSRREIYKICFCNISIFIVIMLLSLSIIVIKISNNNNNFIKNKSCEEIFINNNSVITKYNNNDFHNTFETIINSKYIKIQQQCPSTNNFELYYDNEIVSVSTYKKTLEESEIDIKDCNGKLAYMIYPYIIRNSDGNNIGTFNIINNTISIYDLNDQNVLNMTKFSTKTFTTWTLNIFNNNSKLDDIRIISALIDYTLASKSFSLLTEGNDMCNKFFNATIIILISISLIFIVIILVLSCIQTYKFFNRRMSDYRNNMIHMRNLNKN